MLVFRDTNSRPRDLSIISAVRGIMNSPKWKILRDEWGGLSRSLTAIRGDCSGEQCLGVGARAEGISSSSSLEVLAPFFLTSCISQWYEMSWLCERRRYLQRDVKGCLDLWWVFKKATLESSLLGLLPKRGVSARAHRWRFSLPTSRHLARLIGTRGYGLVQVYQVTSGKRAEDLDFQWPVEGPIGKSGLLKLLPKQVVSA